MNSFQNPFQKIEQNENQTYGEVTCWFNLDGNDLENGVNLRSDFTIEEAIQDAIDKEILKMVDYKIKVTLPNSTQTLATLKEMQIYKLIDQKVQSPEIMIYLRSDGTEPTINVQQQQQQQQQFNNPQFSNQQFNNPQFNFQPQNNINSMPFPNIPQNQNQFKPIPFQQQIKQNNNQQIFNNNIQIENSGFIQQQQQIIQKKEQGITNSQPLSQNIENSTLINNAQNILNQILVLKDVTLFIEQSGEFISYKYHLPKKVQGIFTNSMGTKRERGNNQNNWIELFGIKISEIQGGFAVQWKDGKQNQISLTLQ